METLLTAPDSIPDKIAREGALIAGAALNIGDGIRNAAQQAWNHPEQYTKLIADAAVGGLVIALVAKNPAILGKGLQPVCEFGVANGGKIGMALLATDLSQRVASPVIDTWRTADGINSNKQVLSDKLGSAVVDYALLGIGGFAGAKYGPASLKYCSDFVGTNFAPRPAYALAGTTTAAPSFNKFTKPFSNSISDSPSAKDLVLFNQKIVWGGIDLTGETHLVKPEQTVIEGRRGDIVLHAPDSGKNYIGVKVIQFTYEPTKVSVLNDFDIRDVIAKEHVNFRSESHRLLNLQVIKEAVSKLRGEVALRRDVRHHTIDSYDDCVQYRLSSPLWLDPTIRAPRIELPLTGRITEYETVSPKKGDFFLSHELDPVGAQNKYRSSGPHSGHFTLNIYDDQLWLQKFNLRNFLDYHTAIKDPARFYRFWTKYEMLEKMPTVVETLRPFIKQGELAIWNHNPKKRMFEIR